MSDNTETVLSAEYEPRDRDGWQQYEQYRSLSAAAVTSLVIGFVSMTALLFPSLLIIPLVGIVLGIYALVSVRRRADQLAGGSLAVAGLALSTLLLVGGGAMHWTLSVLEVPEGYVRINFWDLQPDKEYPELPIPPSALKLDGQKIFVKGYVYPHQRRKGLKSFVLVPDMKTCCFGGQPKLTDMIEVTLEDPRRIDFTYHRRKFGGVLRVDSKLHRHKELTGVYYRLTADYVK